MRIYRPKPSDIGWKVLTIEEAILSIKQSRENSLLICHYQLNDLDLLKLAQVTGKRYNRSIRHKKR